MNKLTKIESCEVRDNFMKKGIIHDLELYDNLINNKLLMKVFDNRLSVKLSHKINTSTYGMGLISDFDLYWNPTHFNSLIPNLLQSQYISLMRKRNNLKQLIKRIRIDMIKKMDFVGSP
jgi:hypothetical protein